MRRRPNGQRLTPENVRTMNRQQLEQSNFILSDRVLKLEEKNRELLQVAQKLGRQVAEVQRTLRAVLLKYHPGTSLELSMDDLTEANASNWLLACADTEDGGTEILLVRPEDVEIPEEDELEGQV